MYWLNTRKKAAIRNLSKIVDQKSGNTTSKTFDLKKHKFQTTINKLFVSPQLNGILIFAPTFAYYNAI
jgi:hypothetical protein